MNSTNSTISLHTDLCCMCPSPSISLPTCLPALPVMVMVADVDSQVKDMGREHNGMPLGKEVEPEQEGSDPDLPSSPDIFPDTQQWSVFLKSSDLQEFCSFVVFISLFPSLENCSVNCSFPEANYWNLCYLPLFWSLKTSQSKRKINGNRCHEALIPIASVPPCGHATGDPWTHDLP